MPAGASCKGRCQLRIIKPETYAGIITVTSVQVLCSERLYLAEVLQMLPDLMDFNRNKEGLWWRFCKAFLMHTMHVGE